MDTINQPGEHTMNTGDHISKVKKENPTRFSWKEYLILVLVGMFGTLAGIPAILSAYQKAASTAGIPVQILLGEQLLQTLFWMLATVGVGLFLAEKTNLGAPLLKGFLTGKPVGAKLRSYILSSMLVGVAATAIVKSLDKWFFIPRLPGFSSAISQISGWKGFLASFYGGVTEEILTRLFLLTLLAWMIGWISHTADGKPSRIAMWIAIVSSAILFGLYHMPATLVTVPYSPMLLAREITLNGIAAVPFGYLYWKRGLESSMIAHFSGDILVHLILPLFSF